MKNLLFLSIICLLLHFATSKFLVDNTDIELYEYELILLDPSLDSKCLDGSTPGFYWRKGKQSSNFLVYFEGGGWCGDVTLDMTMQNCYNRSKTDLGSSTNYPKKANFNSRGILSRDIFKNLHFYEYNVAYIKYCDGTGHQGYAS